MPARGGSIRFEVWSALGNDPIYVRTGVPAGGTAQRWSIQQDSHLQQIK